MTDQVVYVPVLDKGYVRYVDHLGGDLSVVNAARASFRKESVRFSESDERLLNFLLRRNEMSPFRHAFVSLELHGPLMVANQLWKYTIGCSQLGDAVAWNEACLPASQRLRTWHGPEVSVGDLLGNKKYPFLRSVSPNGQIVRGKIASVFPSGRAEVYRVTSPLGFSVETTANHRFLTPEGYKPLYDLHPGDLVMMNGVPMYKTRSWLEDHYVVKGLSQKEVADLAGCTTHTIRKWVRVYGLQQDQKARLVAHNRKHGAFGKGETSATNEAIRLRSERMSGNRKGLPAYAHGEAHHAWKGNEAGESAGYKRAQKLYELSGQCSFCDFQAEERHHLDSNPKNNQRGNVVMTCVSHHQMLHGKHVPLAAHAVPISSITAVGVQDVYDIEMDGEPNFVAGQFVLHNSRRYITLATEFYIPVEWRSAPEDKKQGSGAPVDAELAQRLTKRLMDNCEHGRLDYEEALQLGIAPEQARLFLNAYGLYTTWRWSGSLAMWMHVLDERLAHKAQAETRAFAEAIRDILLPLFPVSLAKFAEG